MTVSTLARRDHVILRLALVALMCGAGDVRAQDVVGGAVPVTLSPTTAPSAGQPGVTVLSVTGINFPAGTITPSLITLTLTPVSSGPPMSANATGVATIVGSTRRISFQIVGPNLQNPTLYNVSVSGRTSAGQTFVSSNKAKLTINPPAAVLSLSPNTGGSGQQLSVTITGQYTNFLNGSTTANFGPGISVAGAAPGTFGPVTVNSATSLTAQIMVESSGRSGINTITVSTGVQQATSWFSINSDGGAINRAPMVNAGPNQTISLPFTTIEFTESPTPTPNSGPYSITKGPDGNLWFTEGSANKIGTITTDGKITEFPVPTSGGTLFGITAAPDGNLWFTEYFGNTIWRITTAGNLTPFTLPNGSAPNGITTGPDGNLWFTERATNKIGRMTTSGIFAEFTIPSANSQPMDITAGPDGNLWFAESGNSNGNFVAESKIGKITLDGAITEFPVPTVHSAPIGITAGPDGNLWFSEAWPTVSQIGKITTLGAITEYALPSVGSAPQGMALGPDGNLWFVEAGGNQIGRITTSGAVTEYPIPTAASNPIALVAGPDGNLWFTERHGNQIGKTNFGVFYGKAATDLNGVVIDDGLPPGGILSTSWSQISGPGPISFGDATATFPDVAGKATPVVTSATFPTSGAYVVRLAANDTQLSSDSTVAITVNLPQIPALLSVNPNAGQQGQNALPVGITGEFTNFIQGVTTASFGPGITVTGLTVNSATTATGVLNIDPAAPAGKRMVALTTGGEVATLADGFTVTSPSTSINQAPVVSAGPNLTISVADTAELNGTVRDDGLPNNATLTTTWSAIGATAPQWLQLAPGDGPPPIAGHSAAFDPNTDRMIIFGGGGHSNDAWVLTNADGLGGVPQWSQLSPAPDPVNGLPTPRSFQSLVYDSASNRAIVFGGCFGVCGPTGNDVWVLSHANGLGGQPQWMELFPTGGPPGPRSEHTAVYDPTSNSMIVFGGANAGSATYSEVWVLSNANGLGAAPVWTQLNPSGAFPPGQRDAAAVYDSSNNRMIVFGGVPTNSNTSTNAVWVLANANGLTGTPVWTNLIPEGSAGSPPSRANLCAVYDSQTNRMTIFGGRLLPLNTDYQDTWVLLNANGLGSPSWTQELPTEPLPPSRNDFTGVLNPSSNRMVVFGGLNRGGAVDDVWVFSTANGGVILSNPIQNQPDLSGKLYPVTTTASFGAPGTYALALHASDTQLSSDSVVTITVNPPQILPILSVNPNSGQQGQIDLSVNITAQFTHFVQGTTTANFGPGITVTNLTITSATTATAVLNIDSAAPAGKRMVALTTGGEVASLGDAFTVVPLSAAPSLTSVSPNVGSQGQQNLSVNVIGQNTHFVQGTTTASFGPGITVASLAINSPTTATAVLNIDPAGLRLNFFPGSDYDANTTAMDGRLGTSGYTIDSFESATLIPGLTIQLSGGVPTTWATLPNLFNQNDCGFLTNGQAWDGTNTASNQNANQPTSCSLSSGLASLTTFNYAPGTTSFGIGLSNFQSVNPQFPVTNHELFVNGVDMGVLETLAGLAWTPGLTRNAYLRVDGLNGGMITSVGFQNLPGAAIDDFLMFDHLAILPENGIRRDVTMTTDTEVATLANGFTVAASPSTLTQVNPNTGQQGQQSLSVTVSGANTHFVQGTTTANFGSGITVTNLTITSATTATAVLNIDPAAPAGKRMVALTTGGEVASLGNAFTVVSLGAAPSLTSVSPNVGSQGQQNLSVNIIGQNTHFAQGTTQVSFGSDVTVNSVTVASAESLTANVTIPANATLGGHVLTVTTGTERTSLTDGFAVNEAATLLSITPNNGMQGIFTPMLFAVDDGGKLWTIDINSHTSSLIGSTGFPVVTDLAFGPTGNLFGTTETQLISINRATGAGTVIGSHGPSLTSDIVVGLGFAPDGTLFGITQGSGALITIDPNTGAATTVGAMGYSGVGDITVGPNGVPLATVFPDLLVTVNRNTGQATPIGTLGSGSVATLNFDPATGQLYGVDCNSNSRNLLLIDPSSATALPVGGVGTLCAYGGSFSGDSNSTLVTANISARGTHFNAATTIDVGSGIMVSNVVAVDSTHVSAQLAISSAANPGPRTLAVTTGSEVITLSNAFIVNPNPILSSISPMSGFPGQPNISAIVTGQFTHFVSGNTGVSFGSDITVNSVTVTSATSLTANVTIPAGASLGGRPVTITTGTEIVSLPNGFVIRQGATPVLTQLNPNRGQLGQQNLSVNITGLSTTFAQAVTTADFGPGITVTTLTVNSATSATAMLNLDPGASVGTRTVTVTTGSEVASLANGFSVTAVSVIPSLTQLSPNTGQRGQQNLAVTISGQNTNFVRGMTTANFGGGITVTSLAVNSPTSATAVLNIDTIALPGFRTISLTTGTEIATLADGFSVTSGPFCLSPPVGLVSWWTGDIDGTDLLGVNNPSTTAAVTVVPGKVGSGLSFGQGGSIDIPNSPSLDNQQFTVEAWVRPDGAGPNNDQFGSVILDHNLDNTHEAPALTWSAATNRFAYTFGNQDTETLYSDSVFPPGEFYHVAGTYDGSTFKLFVNGSLQGAVEESKMITYSPRAWSIGSAPGEIRLQGFPRTWNGVIDEVSIYNRALSQGEIQAIYLAGSAGKCKSMAILLSVDPKTGQQGQENLSVNIAGRLTNFVQGTTTADFGAGITVDSITVADTTHLNVSVSILTNAIVGPRTLTVTTGGEIASLAGGFTITAIGIGPTLTSVSPNSGPQGQGGPVAIVGLNTHFVSSVTQLDFGPGITVSNVNVSCPTCLTATLALDSIAATGSRTVTVTTGNEVVTLTNGFTVTAGAVTPILTSMVPASAGQGQSVTSTITGQFTNWIQGTTTVSVGAGITVNSVTVSNPTTLTVQLTVTPNATIGLRTLTVTTGAEVVSATNVFNVLAGLATITQANPNAGQQSQTNMTVSITGQFTNFVQGTTQLTFGTGITINSLTVANATSLTANISIALTAPVGARTITASTGSEVASLTNGFTVTSAGAVLLSANPNTGQQGQNGPVTITGQATHFVAGITQVSFGTGITVSTVNVTNATTLTAQISVTNNASVGTRTVTVSTGAEIVSLNNGFTVQSGTPFISMINPASGQQGQTLPVVITGQFTNFVQGTTTVDFGSGITVGSTAIVDTTHLTAQVSIASSAALGQRTVTVTTGTEVVTALNAFIVSAASVTPGVSSVNPNIGQNGQTNLGIAVTGLNTHFAQGSSVATFDGGGVTVNSVTVTDATHLSANISIAANAAAAAHNVTVTTGSEVASLANAFSVQPATNHPPVITIVPTWSVTLPSRLTINYTATDDGLPLGGSLTVSWEAISTPAGGAFGFQNQTPTSISAGFDTPGTYTLRITATDTQFTATQDVTVTVISGAGGPGPTVSITTPIDGAEVTAAVNVVGSVDSPALSNWVLEYQGPGDTTYTTLATGTTTVSNAILGVFDPSVLLNGIAYIRLRGTDTSGQSTTTSPVSLILTKNQKIGNFTVSFNDLSVPVAGLPIQVVRTYDSRRRNNPGADFSYGWTLDLKAAQLAETAPLGDQWNETHPGGLSPYCIAPVKAHILTASLPDGTTYQFQTTLSPQCQSFVPILQATFGFTPIGTTPPNASLAILGNSTVVVNGTLGPVTFLDEDNFSTFDPDQYILTLPDGRKLQISMQFGLQKMTDLNANTLTVTSTGIVHSSGKSVTFARDAAKRITQITDPAGFNINYTYNNLTGDLASVTDRENNATTFAYDANHYLLTIQDPGGIQPIRNDYDSSGRLIKHTDAFNNVIKYDHNLATHQEVVTDRLNNVTVNEYDADGNVVKVTDALGGITLRTYDGRDNLVSETNALGNRRSYTYDSNNNRLTETDPLNNTTTYTYNSRNQVVTISDALHRLTTNRYDTNGNLASTKDAANNITAYTYNASGLQTSITDAVNGVTGYQYDASGNLTQQTDALNQITTFTYDANGNRLTQTRMRSTTSGPETLLTSYQYDRPNRLIKTNYPDNSVTRIEYNSIGKQSLTIDQLNRQTSYQYDLMGRLLQTTFPDGTNEQSAYDAEGHRIGSTDRALRSTQFVYDALGHLTKTTYADNASNITTYDAIGEVKSTADARVNTTQYSYDTAGHRTGLIDALGNLTGFTYDIVGNQASMKDANGNITQYTYDSLNRRTNTIYADTTNERVTYDALGRTLTKTDQASKTTQFQYDKLSRLTQVTDALNQLTQYTYDEVGNRTSQSDANHHTTTFAYDQLGRRTRRTLPLGMFETQAYDLAGNLSQKTDFNGKTTTYTYNFVNRLLSEIPDASLGEPTVSFAYTATGQRLAMTDASGATTYTYDLRDRLLSKATPEGTLLYTYDAVGNLATMRSSNAGGTSVDYTYDPLNRLSTTKDNRLAAGSTTYAFDKAGNLQGYIYPNGVQSTYTYNQLNRLASLAIGGSSPLASYNYILGPVGNRMAVTEFNGRHVNYSYDSLYRLTNETITGSAVDGVISYIYDAVGNRLSRSSTLPPIPASAYTYDANDRLGTDSSDPDGNTTASSGNTYSYDFENHLKSQNTGLVTIVYDGDGNRVAKTAGGTTTKYLLDDRNLTRYAQVVEELNGSAVQRVYTYGLNRISQSQTQPNGTNFYGYDGQGSVRLLTDSAGAVTDRYDYDAFGNVITQIGITPNIYLYSGEQNDPNLGFYYLRARYLNQSTGRFWTTDKLLGDEDAPVSLHGYLYAGGDPINNADPSGNQFYATEIQLEISSSILAAIPAFAPSPSVFQHLKGLATRAIEEEATGQSMIWRYVDVSSTFPPWIPSSKDWDGLSGTRGGPPLYWPTPLAWLTAVKKAGGPPNPSTDRVFAANEAVLLASDFDVRDTLSGIDPHHVSIGGVLPGIVERRGRASWPGSAAQREATAARLEAAFNLVVFP